MFDKLLNSGNYLDIYIVARWMYKVGNPVFQKNEDFDKFEEIIKKKYPDLKLFNQSYDDDDEPTELLIMYGISNVQEIHQANTPRVERYIDILLDNRSMSIRAVRTYEEAYEWFKQHQNEELVFSIKMDGINIKSLIDTKRGELLVSASRARKENSILRDYTDTVKQKYSKRFKKNYLTDAPKILPVYAEGFVDEEGRKKLNSRYDKSFVNSKTSGSSVLINGIDEDLLEHLRIYVFSSNEGSATLEQSLKVMEKIGFETVPYIVEVFEDRGFDEFKNWVSGLQKFINDNAKEEGIIYDGVVVQVNSWERFEQHESDGMYSGGNIALKFGENEPDIYKAIVNKVELTFDGKSKEQYTAKIFINPITTYDRKTVSVISGYNLANIINKKINTGSEIEILYQSGCDPILK